MDKIIFPNNYMVFITALLPEYSQPIINGMFKKGYLLAPALDDCAFSLGRKEGQAFLITFYAYKPGPGVTHKTVSDDLMDIINTEKMSIYSAIVSERADASITSSNFNKSEDKQTDILHPPPLTSDDWKKVN
jgi:hypothetical protein